MLLSLSIKLIRFCQYLESYCQLLSYLSSSPFAFNLNASHERFNQPYCAPHTPSTTPTPTLTPNKKKLIPAHLHHMPSRSVYTKPTHHIWLQIIQPTNYHPTHSAKSHLTHSTPLKGKTFSKFASMMKV